MQNRRFVVAQSKSNLNIFLSESFFRKIIGSLLVWCMMVSTLPMQAASGVRAEWVSGEQWRSLLRSSRAAFLPPGPAETARGSAGTSAVSGAGRLSRRPSRRTIISVPSQLALRPLSHPAGVVGRLPGVGENAVVPLWLKPGALPVARPLLMQTGPPSSLQVAVAFADSSSASSNFPEPWNEHNPLISFVGGGTVYRAGAVRLDNPTNSAISVDSVTVDLGRPGPVFQLWTNVTVPAGGSAILTQTQDGNFNTSASPIAGCGQSLAVNETRIPTVTVTVAGVKSSFTDTAHVLDTGGFDSSCRGNQSLDWRPIGTTGPGSPAGTIQLLVESAPHAVGTQNTIGVQVNDAANQPLANVPVALKIVNGPNAGKSFSGTTDGTGNASIQYSSAAMGSDLLQAVVQNPSGGALQSQQAPTTWSSADACAAPSVPSAAAARLIYVGQSIANFGSVLRLAALLTDGTGDPLSGRVVSFNLNGQTLTATTAANGTATVLAPSSAPGQLPLTVNFGGDQTFQQASVNASITIQPTATLLHYMGANLVASIGQQPVSALLTDFQGTTAIAGRTVSFTLNGVTSTAVTNVNGVATAQLTFTTAQAAGAAQLQISFAGDADYKASTRTASVEVFQTTSFVIWGGNSGGLKIGQQVNFWGAQWASQVTGGQYGTNPSFKGFAQMAGTVGIQQCQPNATLSTLTDSCWESKPGDSAPPSTLPNTIALIVSTAITKSGSSIFGNIACEAVVKVNPTPAYGPDPGHPGYGVVLAVNGNCAGVFPNPVVLSVSQQQPTPVLPGQQATVAYSITNQGATDATAVMLTENFDQVTPATGSANIGIVPAGQSRSGSFQITIPAIGARQSAESSTDYQTRLAASDGRLFTSEGEVTFSDPFGQIYPPVDFSSFGQLSLPRLNVGLSGASCIAPGTLVSYPVTLENLGSATASQIAAQLSLPDSSVATPQVPDLTPGTTFAGTVKWQSAPVTAKGANESTQNYLARLQSLDGVVLPPAVLHATWHDALANFYGPVDQPFASLTERIPVISVATPGTQSLLPGQQTQLSFGLSNIGTGNAVQATLTLKRQDGSLVMLPGFSLPGGQNATLTANYTSPTVAAKGASETDAAYLARLGSLNGATLSLDAILNWSDAAKSNYGPTDNPFSLTEQLPIVNISVTAPVSANAGDTISYVVTVTNTGSAVANIGNTSVTLPDGSVQHPAFGSSTLAPGASASASVSFITNSAQSAGTVVGVARVAWTDASANVYGPVSASASTNIAPSSGLAANAGPDQTVPTPNDLPLQGSVQDNHPAHLTTQWSLVSGPASVTFSNPLSPTSTVHISQTGIYVLQLSASDPPLNASSTVTITAVTANRPPVVSAGPDQTILLPINSATLNGTASDPQGSPLTLTWNKVSGPGAVSFANPAAAATTATFSVQGVYILRLTAVNSLQLTGSADVRVTVVPQNQPPVVNAGPDQTIALPSSATLNGTATDDGLPAGSTLTVQWSVVNGPGAVQFSSQHTPATQASFTVAGDYVLSLSANDTQFISTATVKVSVAPPPAVITLSGPATLLVGTVANLRALVTDANNVPLTGATLQFTVSGSNATSGSVVTDATGVANFSYTGNNAGLDSVVAGVQMSSSNVVSNAVAVNWAKPVNAISTTAVHAIYFPATVLDPNSGQGSFTLLPGEQPLGVRDYSTLAFNAIDSDALNANAGLGGTTLPMVNFTVDVNDQWTGTVTEIDNNGNVYGANYQVAYLGNFVVAAAGDYTFTVFSDDGFLVGIQGASYVSGPNSTVISTTGVQGYPALAGNNFVSDNTYTIVVHFPAAGIYPYEWDYFTDPFFSALVVGTPGSPLLVLPPVVSLALTPNVSTTASGQQQISVQALGASGLPSAGVAVQLNISGPNAQSQTANTDSTGVARFHYTGSQSGDDRIQATALIDGFNAISNELVLHWNTSSNQPPVVNAGPSPTLQSQTDTPKLNGTVSDDGLPNGQLYSFWSKVSGPGNVTFSIPNYDPAADFSASSNPSGTWTYGWEPFRGGTFTPYAAHELNPLPLWFPSPQSTFPVLGLNNLGGDISPFQSGALDANGAFYMAPGPAGENSVLRWTAPSAGTFLVQGRFFAEDLNGTSTDVAVLLNSTAQLLSGNVNGKAVSNGHGPAVPFSFLRTVNAGDTLDFTVGFGNDGNNASDSTGLFLTILSAASPTTTASFSLPGDYVLRLSASDTELMSSSDVAVHVPAACVPTPQGLVAWWPGDGNANDLVSGRNGTVEGALTFAAGEVGESFQLNGTDADVLVPNPPPSGTTGLSLGAWIFPTNVQTQQPILAFDGGVQIWANAGFNFNVLEQVTVPGALFADFGNFRVLGSSPGVLKPGQWNHVMLTYDPSLPTLQGKLTVNAVPVALLNMSTIVPQTAVPLYMGAIPGNSSRFSGGIDEVQQWNRPLSPLEILGLFAAGPAGECKNNAQLLVNAGPNQTITLPVSQVTLSGTASNPSGGGLTVTWSKVSGPGAVGFADPASPATAADFNVPGVYVLRLTASAQTTVTSDTTVTVNGNNQLVVSAGANQTVELPTTTVTLNGSVSGANAANTSLQWSELSGPASVSFTNPTAAVTQATFSVTGTYLLQLSASAAPLSASATVSVIVLPAGGSGPVVFVSASPRTLQLPSNLVNLTGTVQDSLPVTQVWSQVSGPGAAIFNNPTAASTQATFSVPGTYVVQLTASDAQATASASATITVQSASGNQAPVVSIIANPSSIQLPANTITLVGTVSDDGLPVGAVVTQQWSQVSGPAPITFTSPNSTSTQAIFSAAGTYVVALTASDTQLQTTAQASLLVLAQPAPAPTVSITSPTADAEVTSPTNVIGNVSNGNWKLEYALLDGSGVAGTYVQFAQGSGAVTNAPLGTFDPTVLFNGEYSIRLTATDNFGQSSFATVTVGVSRNMKVGIFTLSFNDLSVPMPGFPVTVTRTYDSRDKRVGDFGTGWTLSLANVRVQKNGPIGKTWDEEVAWQGLLPEYCLEPAKSHVVSFTFADGRVYKFQAGSNPECQQAGPITAPTFVFNQVSTGSATSGASLVPIGDTNLIVDGAVPGPQNIVDLNGNVIDYTQFKLTTAEGFVYTIDQTVGVTQVQDPNGNTLTISANGIIHSSGKSVTFARDAQNRITQITDPNGAVIQYQYSAAGDLTDVVDRAGQTTGFAYDSSHFLTNITDPRGVQAIRNIYDAGGRLISTTDASGNTMNYTHALASNQEAIQDRLGNTTTYTYDQDGNVVQTVDALGNTTSATYDANDNQLTATDALGKISKYAYDQGGNQISQTDPLGNTTQYTYNLRKQALTVLDARNKLTQNSYDPNGNLLVTTDPLGKQTIYKYLGNGLPFQMTDADQNSTGFGYDGTGNLTSQTDALGNISTFTYDGNNNRLTQTVTRTKADGTREFLTKQYVYDGNNRLVKTIAPDGTNTKTIYNAIGKQSDTFDALGRTTHYDYDSNGRLVKTTYPDNTSESIAYDANDRRVSMTDRGGRVTAFTYDALGRQTKTTFADGSFTQTVYDAAGRVQSTTDANSNVTTYGYDDAGRRTSATDALGNVSKFVYDAAGNQTAFTDALTHTTNYVYDDAGRRTQTIFPDQTTETIGYDALGRQTSKTDQAGKVTQFGYDPLGRLSTVTDALHQITSYGYDELGNRITQTDANNHTTKFAYDQLGRRVSRALPLGMSESYGYDTIGNLIARTDFNGKTTSYKYDPLNRLLQKIPDASFAAPTVVYSYTPTGRRATMTDASGPTSYTYDTRDRLLTKATPFGTLTYTYDAAGNALSLKSSNSNGASMAYGYDALNRLATVTDASGVTSYTYDPVGNLSGYSYPNGVATSYVFDPLNRLTSMQSTCSTAAPGCGPSPRTIASYTYTLGAAGNRLSVAELSGRTVQYGYDDLYRLTSESISGAASQNGTVNYQYDAVGNRKQLNSTVAAIPTGLLNYDANDRISTQVYDNNGNTINNGTQNVYDFENHLIQRGNVSIVYDGDGNRVSETVAGVTTNYLVADQNPTGYAQVVDELQSGAVSRTYNYGLSLISQRLTANGQGLSFYGYDGHGSVRFLTDATGSVTDTYDYDAFGNLIAQTGTTANNYLFAGEQFDPALGVYYNRARYYDERLGRFWSMDTWEGGSSQDAQSLHRYLYANANPVNRVDPSGMESLVEETEAAAIDQTLEAKADVQPVKFWRRAFVNKTWDVYLGIYPTESFPFVHSFIYTNRRGINEGITWDVGIFEGPLEFLRTFFDPNGFLLPRPTTLGAMERYTSFHSGALFKFASFNDKQYVVWTFLMLPIGATVKLGEVIRIPFSIIPIPGLNSCLKWTFEAGVAALGVQVLPL